MCIYKITNLKNNKLYIGLTTVSIEQRWKGHVTQANIGNQKPLYRAIRKYGVENFTIESIYDAESFEELGDAERWYIQQYNTRVPNGYNLSAGGEHNQLDGNPRARLSIQEVYDIREIYSTLSMCCSECYEQYKDKISYSAFEKIWEGRTWTSIHMDVYTELNKQYHTVNCKINNGESNGNGLSDLNILQARLYYVNHTLAQTYEAYGELYKSQDAFRGALNYGYKHMPIYRKTIKKWFLSSKEIDINTWMESNPVSTISVSGE